jgi:cysteine desulfurase
MIYLDYQSTTPLAPEALEAMLPYLRDHYGNPHSSHAFGRQAAAAVAVAREQVAALLPKGGRVIFTSGATEAINLAIKGCGCGANVAALATEHAAVLDCVEYFGGEKIEVDAGGLAQELVIPAKAGIQHLKRDVNAANAALDSCLRGNDGDIGAKLYAAMLINNEIGVIQPIAQLAEQAHTAGALFLCDAVQAYGRIAIPDGPDMIAISAHKIHGPKGIGALWVRDGLQLEPLIHGGGQEQGLRSGTLSPALCTGFGVAAQIAAERMEADAAHVAALWDHGVSLFADWTINGSTTHRYKGNLNIRRDGIDINRLMSECRDIAFSAGSACASGSGRPSHVLRAIGLTDQQAKTSIRLGFGRYTTVQEVEQASVLINAAVERQMAP